MPDQSSSHFDRFLQSILASRFLTISALIHILLIVLFGEKVLFTKYVEPPDFQSTGEGGTSTDVGDTPAASAVAALPPTPTLEAPPVVAPPASSLTALTSINTNSSGFSMPLPAIAPPTLGRVLQSQAAAPAQVLGTGPPVRLPGLMAGRGAAQRAGTGLRYGAKPASEPAVLRALRWLQSQQLSDGTWGSPECKGGYTGLALLCFLGHGETPQSSHEFGVVVNNAIAALVTEANNKQGRMAFFGDGFTDQNAPYNHGIATYALCEAYAMTKDDSLVPIIRQAVGYIVKAQRPDGGWAYRYDTTPDKPGTVESDTSVCGWQIQALKAAHLTGIPGMEETVHPVLDHAMQFLDSVFDPRDGTFGYHKPGEIANHFLTGVGVASKLTWLGRADSSVHEGLKNIISADLNYSAPDCNLYAWYYNTQACYQAQGAAWEWWKARFQDQLTGKQSADGSWPPTGGQEAGKTPTRVNLAVDTGSDGPLYRATLSCLMLEVFYRYLPTNPEATLGQGL